LSGLRYRLENWGRWGRLNEDKPRVSAPILWQMIYDKDDSQHDQAVEAVLPPINHRDAERISEYLQKLAQSHVETLRREFYLRTVRPPILEVAASLRALQDVIDDQRAAPRFVQGAVIRGG
jgi:hypothetical protein